MKLAQFNVFCWRQWEDGGTVESVRLSDADFREMAEEVLAHAATAAPGTPRTTHVRMDSIFIPPSGTVATIDPAPDGEAATARVKYGPTATTRTVPVA